MKTKDKIIVGFVWWLIAFEAFSWMYLYVPQLYVQNIVSFFCLVPMFIIVVSLLCVSYFKATLSTPGNPSYIKNMHYQEELEDIKNYARRQTDLKKQRRKNKKKGKIDLQEISSLNKMSFCFKCDVVKQERVHHCSVCRKCVMRMDHHCPWVGNCVGRLNHKYFILFLLYATWGLFMVAITITVDYIYGSTIAQTLPSEKYKIWLYVACVSSYLLALSIGFLFVTQMITSCQNITTLQSFTQGIQDHNPFTTGSVIENLRQIFGNSKWLLPVNPFPDFTQSPGSTLDVVL